MSRSRPPLAYAANVASFRAPEGRGVLRERIAELTKRLRIEHDQFEQAAQSWTEEAAEKKRDARKAREGTLREIEELLAGVAASEKPPRLEPLPFAQKLTELEAWVAPRAAASETRLPATSSEIRRVESRTPAPRKAPVPPVPPLDACVSQVVSVGAVVAAPPSRAPDPASTSLPAAVSAPAKPVPESESRSVPAIESTKPTPPPVMRIAAPAVEPSSAPAIPVAPPLIPALPLVARDRRALAMPPKIRRATAIGGALLVIGLSFFGWRAAHPRRPLSAEDPPPPADHAPAMIAALGSASQDSVVREDQNSCPPVPCPCAERSASAPKRAPAATRAPQTKPSRLTWPSFRGSHPQAANTNPY